MNQENQINPDLLDQFENFYGQRLTAEAMADFNHRLSHDTDFKAAYEGYLLSREAINEKIESSLRQDLKNWQNQNSEKTRPRIYYLSRWRAAIAACLIGLVSLVAIKNYKLNKFIDEKIVVGLDLAEATRSIEQSRVGKIISDYAKDKAKQLSELEKISVSDPDYYEAQKYLGQNSVLNGDCTNTKKYLINSKASQQDVSLAVILCHLKGNQYDEEFETELNAILSDRGHNNYKMALEIKQKMSSIWWKILK